MFRIFCVIALSDMLRRVEKKHFLKAVWANCCILCKLRGLQWHSATRIKFCVAAFSTGLLYSLNRVVGRGYFMLVPTVLSINAKQQFDILPILLSEWMVSCWYYVFIRGPFKRNNPNTVTFQVFPVFQRSVYKSSTVRVFCCMDELVGKVKSIINRLKNRTMMLFLLGPEPKHESPGKIDSKLSLCLFIICPLRVLHSDVGILHMILEIIIWVIMNLGQGTFLDKKQSLMTDWLGFLLESCTTSEMHGWTDPSRFYWNKLN